MAYDTPKAAHFTLRDSQGVELLTTEALQMRWTVAGIIQRQFHNLLGLTQNQVAEIDKICLGLSNADFIFTFRHHREF